MKQKESRDGNGTPENANSDKSLVASLVVQYYEWLSGNGGTSSDDLLAMPLTQSQRKLLLARMDDVNVVFSITASVRCSTREEFSEDEESEDIS